MSGVMQRTMAILERLAADVDGLPLSTLADELDIPRSAAHRLLTELAELGYVRQSRDRGDYRLTTKLVSLGLTHLKLSGVTDLCQPIISRLAAAPGELARRGGGGGGGRGGGGGGRRAGGGGRAAPCLRWPGGRPPPRPCARARPWPQPGARRWAGTGRSRR